MSTTNNGWTLSTASDLRVVGSNPEMADMSNPRGDIIREVWFVTAEKGGKVFAHDMSDAPKTDSDPESGASWTVHSSIGPEGSEAARVEMEAVLAAGSDPDSQPDAWGFWRTVYGSQAYLVEVAEMTDEQRADHVEF